MIAFYTIGAGMGHLTRTLKVINALHLKNPIIVFSNSQFIQKDQEFVDLKKYYQHLNIKLMSVTPETQEASFLLYFIDLLNKNKVQELYIDCFPVGIYGELNGLSKQLPNITIHLIARLIDWQNYKTLINKDNHFSSIFFVEELDEEQSHYYQKNSKELKALLLNNLLQNIESSNSLKPEHQQPFCLIVHSGTQDEVAQLIDYCIQKLRFNKTNYKIVLISPWGIPTQYKSEDISVIQGYPIQKWLVSAKIIVSGGGFNLMNEVCNLGITHWVLPFERKYDNQFIRLAKHKKVKI